jgi:fructose-1,6-bisphosphatase I
MDVLRVNLAFGCLVLIWFVFFVWHTLYLHLLSVNHCSTIFGVAPYTPERPFTSSGRSLVAAGYALYSASTELILAIRTKGDTAILGFALKEGTFYLSRTSISCPPWGPFYSLNEAREPDWPMGLRRWVQDAKNGRLHHSGGTKYSSRYVCSLCADVHRTLLKGGWAGNPRPHLRLLYEAAPMAFLCQAAGGKGSDGTGNILDIVPETLHQRICVFLGSMEDINSIESYGDVQQGSKKYDI